MSQQGSRSDLLLRLSLLLLVRSFLEPAALAVHLFPNPLLETGGGNSSVVAADFNRDGRPDLATARIGTFQDPVPNEVQIFFGAGPGEFLGPEHQPVSQYVPFLLVGDFNGDGWPDLAVSDSYSGGVSLLLNVGDGRFLPEVQVEGLGDSVYSITLGDFNEDGRTDLAVLSFPASEIVILLARPDGTLEIARRLDAGQNPVRLIAGDFDGDGRQDLVIVEQPEYSYFAEGRLLLGIGTGDFLLSSSFETFPWPTSGAAADLNADGSDDLVLSGFSYFSSIILVFLGGPDGKLEWKHTVFVPGEPGPVVMSDLNGDGALDLVYTITFNRGGFSAVSFGDGEGSFGFPILIYQGDAAVAVGDFNQDERPDLVTAGLERDALTILPGIGDGTFGVPLTPLGIYPRSLSTGDFNEDGRADLAFVNRGSDTAAVLLGHGDGTFDPERLFGSGKQPEVLAVRDFDGDGKLDLATANRGSCDVSVLLGSGEGSFATEIRQGLPAEVCMGSVSSMAAGDFDGDRIPDLAVAVEQPPYYPQTVLLAILLGRGDGTFAFGTTRPAGVQNLGMASGDFTNDGLDDLVVLNYECHLGCDDSISGYAYLLPALGEGRFGLVSEPVVIGSYPTRAAIADLDRDGNLDLVASGYGLTVAYGSGSGGFSETIRFPQLAGGSINVDDFNADGALDLALDTRVILPGSADRTFARPLRFLGLFAEETIAEDFNADGRPDLVALYRGEDSRANGLGGLGVLLNTGPFPPLIVPVDIRPGDESNRIGLKSAGMLLVAILGTSDVPAATIDPASVRLAGASPAAPERSSAPLCRTEDVSGDARADLLCRFEIQDLGLRPGENVLELQGKTYAGRTIRGEDTIRVLTGRRRP